MLWGGFAKAPAASGEVAMTLRVVAALLFGVCVVACGQPRPVSLQGDICKSMATYGQLPVPWPDITPDALKAEVEQEERARRLGVAAGPPVLPLTDSGSSAFPAKIEARAVGRQGPPPS